MTIDHGLPERTGYALETLRLGKLMRDSGYVASPAPAGQIFGFLPWRGSMDEVDRKIAELQTRRTHTQTHLDEAVLDDVERERLAAERAARVTSLNALPQRKTRGDGSQYDKYPDGRIVEVDQSSSTSS